MKFELSERMAINGNGFPPFDTHSRDTQINQAIQSGNLGRAGELLAPYETKERQKHLLNERLRAMQESDIARVAALTLNESIK